jgi:hypothetical protein
MRDTSFRLSRLLAPADRMAASGFRSWVEQSEILEMRAVELTASRGRSHDFRCGEGCRDSGEV